jgi:hypothetical protein
MKKAVASALIQLTQNPFVLPTSTQTVVPNWDHAQTASIGVETPVSKILPPAAVVASNARPSVAEVGALANLKVAGLVPVVALRSNCRVGSAGSSCVAVAGARVKDVVVTVRDKIGYPLKMKK